MGRESSSQILSGNLTEKEKSSIEFSVKSVVMLNQQHHCVRNSEDVFSLLFDHLIDAIKYLNRGWPRHFVHQFFFGKALVYRIWAIISHETMLFCRPPSNFVLNLSFSNNSVTSSLHVI